MRLDQKYFVPFMVVVAIITMGIIVFSSFSFNHKRQERFYNNVAESDSLLTKKMPIVGESDSLNMQSKIGNPSILVFWASWSEKSINMLDEIERFQQEHDSVSVVAALVKDAEESLPTVKDYSLFTYTDGTQLFNDLKVPGYPSYILFDKLGNVLYSHIGYKEGAGYDTLKTYLK